MSEKVDSRKLIVALAALCLGVSVIGCADSADETTAATVKKAVFVTQENKICRHVTQEYAKSLKELGKRVPQVKTERGTPAWDKAIKKQQEAEVESLIPILNEAAAELRDAGAPQGDEQASAELGDSLEAAAADLEANPGQEVIGSKSPFIAFDKLAKEKGLTSCAF